MDLQEVASLVLWTRITTYVNFASGTIVALDWLLTFDWEVSFIWKSDWSVMKVLYLLARYLPFVDVTLVLYHHFAHNPTNYHCQRLFTAQAFFFVAGATLVELIFTLRTWAVWKQDKRLMPALVLIFCATWTGVFMVGIFYLKKISHRSSPVPTQLGCFMVSTTPILFIGYVLLMLYDAFLLTLMLIRGIYMYRLGGRGSRLVVVVFGDGIIYFFYIFVISFINIVANIKLPDILHPLLMIVARVLHAVLACRVILHIREQAASQQNGGLGDDLTLPVTDPSGY
ncbi:hypothetical protein NP233_g1532 [Leucocoprinus birnbaumii]|uniref:DUF6533 domain-containing protein n=1 Tax=Leucocoprinus birnbaumii TaxID=56174 RepID=A0AAD5W0S3_9AGAR|nr:hypothetical protein NP233_g1532 [Leucocoprinus birnbaumii]